MLAKDPKDRPTSCDEVAQRIEEYLEGAKERERRRQEARTLCARARDVVVLAYVHGMSHGELAGRLKVPLGTVKSWVRRSLFALQECMG